MNFKHEKNEWGGYEFIRVSKKRFENFIRFFKDKIEGNSFMGWSDWYDWSLNGNLEVDENTSEEEFWHNLLTCNVAREYYETPNPEYWLRLDYIEANHYDLDTIVPKPRKKRLTKKEKQLADFICDAFDYAFRQATLKQFSNDDIAKEILKGQTKKGF